MRLKKFLIAVAAFLIFGVMAHAQTVNGFDGTYIYWDSNTGKIQKTAVAPFPFKGIPSGGCLPTQLAIDTLDGDLYTCSAVGVWQGIGNAAYPSITDNGAQVSISASSCTAGPRPWIDVTCSPYNADPTGNIDSTTAIQAAINAACADFPIVPIVFFPTGRYLVGQSQSPSTVSPLQIACSVELLGGGGGNNSFSASPEATLQVANGASPNAAALISVFNASALVHSVTIKHLFINGHNEALSVTNTNSVWVTDSTLQAQVTGQPDNTPLRVSDSLWFWMIGGVLGFNDSNPGNFKSLYDAMLIGEAGSAGVSTIDYLIHFEDVTGFGGAIIYDQRVASNTNNPSNFTFINLSFEDSANSVFTLASTGGTPVSVDAISLDHARIEDPENNVARGVLEIQNGMGASGIHIVQSDAPGPAILQTLGSFNTAHIEGCATNCSVGASDGSGNIVAGSNSTNASGGIEVNGYGSPATREASWLRTDPLAELNGPSFRSTAAGSYFSTIGIDPTLGDLFSDGASYGYTARLLQSTPQTLDIGFANTLPPTNVVGTATTGGTLAAGTYYYFIVSNQGGASCDPTVGLASTTSLASNAVVVTAPNDAVSLTWSLPIGSIDAIGSYCVIRTNTPFFAGSSAQWSAFIVNGGSSTSGTDFGGNPNGPWQASPVVRYMTSTHRWTPNSLSIGTLSVISHALAVNGGYDCPSVTKSSAYSLVYGDCIVNVTGTTTITVPHAQAVAGISPIFHVFDSGSATVTLVCDSGNINGGANVTRTANQGFSTVTNDGTNCFAY